MDPKEFSRKKTLSEHFIEAAEEEDMAVFSLSLLSRNDDQLNLFGSNRAKVEKLLQILIEDTEKHRELLMKAAEIIIYEKEHLNG